MVQYHDGCVEVARWCYAHGLERQGDLNVAEARRTLGRILLRVITMGLL